MKLISPARPERALSWRALGSALALVSFGTALLAYPAQVRDSVAQSALYCLVSLTPSLFPFMVAASYGVRSQAGMLFGRALGPAVRHLFRLPACAGATLLLSFLGGYPAGARGISLLLEQGRLTREQAGRMMLFCVAPGAAFVVTFLGCGALGSLRLGWLLFFAVTLSGLLLGLLTGLGKPLPEKEPPQPGEPGGPALVRSVSDASSAVVKMCGCILLFAGFTAILQGSGAFQALSRLLALSGLVSQKEAGVLLSFLLEVTGGTGEASRQGAAPLLYAFGLAFGGLCVHLQLFSLFPEFPLSKGKFFLFRLLHGFLAAGIFLLLARLFPPPPRLVWASSEAELALGGPPLRRLGVSLCSLCAWHFSLPCHRGRKVPKSSPLHRERTCAIIPLE